MWAWIILGGYAMFVAVLVSCVAHAALSRDSTPKRRETAYKDVPNHLAYQPDRPSRSTGQPPHGRTAGPGIMPRLSHQWRRPSTRNPSPRITSSALDRAGHTGARRSGGFRSRPARS